MRRGVAGAITRAWPAVTYERLRWQPSTRSGDSASRAAQPYRAATAAEIVDVRDVPLSTATRALATEAATEIARFDQQISADLPQLDARRYHFDMAFVVKLSPEDTEALREQAAREHRSMHEVAVLAIQARITADRRAAVLDQLYDAAAVEDAELLDRLAK